MSLAEFLLARIAEDEAVPARIAEGGIVTRDTDADGLRDYLGRDRVQSLYIWGNDWAEGIGITVARVLAECEAKRRIVERARHAASAQANGVINPASIASEIAWTDCLRLLALPYADHPDYREEWRP